MFNPEKDRVIFKKRKLRIELSNKGKIKLSLYIILFLTIILLFNEITSQETITISLLNQKWQEKNEFLPGEEVFIKVSGPSNEFFTPEVYDEGGLLKVKKSGVTDSHGNSLPIPLGSFEEGKYTVVVRMKDFITTSIFFVKGSVERREGRKIVPTESKTTTSLPINKVIKKTSVGVIEEKPLEDIIGLELTGKENERGITETLISNGLNISTFGKRIKIIKRDVKPFSQELVFAFFNDDPKNSTYVVLTSNGKIKNLKCWHFVNKTKKVFDEAILLAKTNRFWEFLENKSNILHINESYLRETLHPSVLPKDGEEVFIYHVNLTQNDWQYFAIETDNSPGKFLILDPAGASWWNESWNYTREIVITENSGNDLEEYQIMLWLDTASLISQGKMNEDCSDIRFVWYNETSQQYVNVPYYIDEGPGITCNRTNTLIWVKVPLIAANSNTTIHMYYGNPDANPMSNITAVFTYSKPKQIYFAIGDFVSRSDIDVISYVDNNNITLNSNGESIVLNEGEIYTGFDAADIQAPDSWNVTGPVAFGCPGADCDTPNPISFAGTEFIRFVDRYTSTAEWFVYAPFSDGTVYWYNASASTGGSWELRKVLSVTKGVLYTVTDVGGLDDNVFLINSTTPILLAFEGNTNRDTTTHVPAAKDAWGISEDVAYGYPNTERTLCKHDTPCSTTTVDGPYRENLGGNADGKGVATHINASKYFGQGQTADGDGYESLVYWPEWELSKIYYIPVAFEYLSGSLTEGGTNSCSWRNGTTGTFQSFTPTGTYSYPNPKKIYVGDAVNEPADNYGVAGSVVNCTYPFFLYIEPNNGDEANLLSFKQARQYIWPEPSVTIKEEINQTTPKLYAEAGFLTEPTIYENTSIILEGNCSEVLGLANATEVYMILQDNSTGAWSDTPTSGNVFSNATYYYLGLVENGTTVTRHFNVTVRNEGEYFFRVVCNASNTNEVYSETQKLTVNKAYGKLIVSLITPPTDQTIEEEIYKTFWVNTSVECKGPTPYVKCYEVNGTAYYSPLESDWGYRKEINITETSGSDLMDYQVNLTIDTASLISQGKMNKDCSDIRFKDTQGNEIPYWIESGCNTSSTRIWIKLNLTASSTKTIYMYYGNPSAESKSNITEVMGFIEFEKVTVTNEEYSLINLQHHFKHPIVVASPEYPHGPDAPPYPMGVIIKDVTPTSFKVKVDRPEGSLTGTSTIVHYMVMEIGAWYILNSTSLIQAGEVNTTKDAYYSGGAYFGSPNYAEIVQFPVAFSSSPAVLHTRTTENNALWAVTYVGAVGDRTNTPNTTHMDISLLSGQLGDQDFVTKETLHWIAIESSSAGEFNGTKWSAENSAEVVRGFANSPYYWSTPYTQTYSSTPEVIIVGKIKEDGGNGAWAVLSEGDSNSTHWASFVDETSETDRSHVGEIVSGISFSSSGSLPLRKYTSSLPSIAEGEEEYIKPPINTNPGDTPFYTLSQQPQTCGVMKYGDVCNLSWLVNSTGKPNSYWKVFVKFESNNSNVESNETEDATIKIVDLTSPEWSDLGASNSTPLPGDVVTFYAYWKDNYNLSAWIFSWNATLDGSWDNKTSDTFFGRGNWSNVTLEIPGVAAGKTIGYRFYANDSSDNSNSSDIGIIQVQQPPDETPPVINDFWVTPSVNGYGRSFTIEANVTDNVAVYIVQANITYPNGSSTLILLENTYDDIYSGTLSDTWQNRTYSFFIWANDTAGNTNDTSNNPKNFYVKANVTFYVKTKEDIYGASDNVLLTSETNWWNYSWLYRLPITLTETSGSDLIDYQVNLTIDTASLISQGKMNEDCSDIRFVDSDNQTELNYWVETGCNSENTKIWVKLNLTANSQKMIYLYYGNATPIEGKNNKTATMDVFLVGSVQASDSWTSVTFPVPIQNPVVIARPASETDTQSGDTRIRNLDSTGFEIHFDEEPAQDGTHGTETFHYIVAPVGVFEFLDGKRLEVHKYQTSTLCTGEGTCNWDTRSYNYSFSSTPVVLAMLQTDNDDSFAYTVQDNIGTSLFQTAIGLPATITTHSSETIGWIAIETGTGEMGGVSYEVTITPNSIKGHDNGWTTVSFQQTYDSTPYVIATMQTRNGGDGGWLRRNTITTSSVEFHVDEDQLSDTEQSHIEETAGMFVIESTGIYAIRKYATSKPSVNIGSEEQKPSFVENIGATNTSAYLLIQIQKNSTGEVISTSLNDTQTGTKRDIDYGERLNIGTIYNLNPWNTDSVETGYYKIVVYLTDNKGNILTNDDGTNMTGSYVFYVDITPPKWNNLGANDTNPKPNDYVKFYGNWSDNGILDKWEFYWNASGSWEKAGEGSFTSNPDWSNITLQIPTQAEAKVVGYYFKANDTEGSYNTTDVYTIEVQDVTPPTITNEQVQPLTIHRNDNVNITAEVTDNKQVDKVWSRIGISADGYTNETMNFLSGTTYNLTYKSTEIGTYNATVFANDTSGNEGSGSTLLTWTVYGWTNVSWVLPQDGSYPVESIVNLTCGVFDKDTNIGIANYPVKFWYNGTLIGINYTNSSGYATYAWNTTGLSKGSYFVNCTISDNHTLFYDANIKNDYTTITILVPEFRVIDIEHENEFELGINEYETGDTIDWVNVTIENYGGATGRDVNITLDILDASDSVVNWYSTKIENCGNVMPSGTCEKQFPSDQISTSASADIYKWNITIVWLGGGTPPHFNSSVTFMIHHIPNNLSSIIKPQKITQGETSYYNFTITNPWSASLTNVNVTINCPEPSMNCTCDGTTQDYCNLGNLGSGESKTATFRIETQTSTPAGDYKVNVTLNYTNPGNEFHSWSEQQTQILKVREPTVLRVNISQISLTATRGSLIDIKGYVNNTGASTLTQVWLNYTLPSGWSNYTGKLNVYNDTLCPSCLLWNNITANISLNSKLGANTVSLTSESYDQPEDWEMKTVYVYANTSIPYVWINNSNPYRNETVELKGRVLYDNGTGISGETVYFYLGDYLLGSNITNTTGYAQLETRIPWNASLGSNLINVTYEGSSSIYTNPSFNDSLSINVKDEVLIENVSATPQVQGYGLNVIISADVWSRVKIDKVRINLTYPNTSWELIDLEFISENKYGVNLTDTWQNGTYSFYLIANNTAGFENQSSLSSFKVEVNVSITLVTEKDVYKPDNIVYLQGKHWWNASWKYRTKILINNSNPNNLEEYQFLIKLNTSKLYSQNKIKSDCGDLRFTWYNESSDEEVEIPYYIDICNISGISNIWFKVPFIQGNGKEIVYVYYGNSEAQSKSNITSVFSYSEPRTIGYVVSDRIVSNGLKILSLCDNNQIRVGGNTYNLNEMESITITSGLAKNTSIKAKCLVQVEGDGSWDDIIVPISWASTEFIYDGFRDSSDTFCMLAPFEDASVTIYVTGNQQWQGTVTSIGTCPQFNAADDTGLRIVSDKPILVAYYGAGGSDAWSFYPATTETLYGVASQYFIAAAGPNGASISYTRSDTGETTSTNIAANEDYQLREPTGGTWDSGLGPALKVKTDNTIGAIQQADHDNTESSTFAPLKEMTTKFGSAEAAEYIVMATPFSDTQCTLYDSSSSVLATNTTTGSNGIYKVCFYCGSDASNIPAGWKVECNRPVWPYYEEDANGEETNLLGWKQMRQYVYPEPTVEIKEEEAFLSIKTIGTTSFKGYLLMGIEKKVDSQWQWIATISNETTPRTITQENPLALADIWSQNAWNTNDYDNGTYRVYVALRDVHGNVLKNKTGYINASYEFTLLSAKINVTIINEMGSENENSNIKIYNQTGHLIASDWGSVSKAVEPSEIYDIVIINNLANGKRQITRFEDVNVTQDFQINPQIVEDYSGNLPIGISDVTPVYAQEDLTLNYDHAQLTIPKSDLNVSYILHCTDWNFTTANCNAWEVNETSDYNMQENSTHIWFNVTHFQAYTGGQVIRLLAILNAPADNTVVPQYRNFTINATVVCLDGNCGLITGYARYNASSSNPDTPISTNPGDTPFYTFDPNPQSCNLNQNENCTMVWKVNSTGNLRDHYKIGVMFNTSLISNHTVNNTVEIGKVLIMSLSWSLTDFGVCDPATTGNPALLNDYLGYNITIDPNSNDVEGLWIKGTDLQPESISEIGEIVYLIKVGNISWNDEINDYEDVRTERLTYNYKLMRSNVPSGSVITTFYWIDIPRGEYAQKYNGKLYIMANTSY